MTTIEKSAAPKENTLATMSDLYPIAFALVTASNSRSGQTLQIWEDAGALDQRRHTELFLQKQPAVPVGIHPIVKNVPTI